VWVCSALTDSLRNCSKSCIRTLMLFLTCLIFLSSETQKMICFGPYNESQLGADVVGQCGLSVYGPKWLFKWSSFMFHRINKSCRFVSTRGWVNDNKICILVSSPKNENSVSFYSPSCWYNPARLSLIFGTQIKIFLIKSESCLTP